MIDGHVSVPQRMLTSDILHTVKSLQQYYMNYLEAVNYIYNKVHLI